MAKMRRDYDPEEIRYPDQKIVQSDLVHEMEDSYIEYAMSSKSTFVGASGSEMALSGS